MSSFRPIDFLGGIQNASYTQPSLELTLLICVSSFQTFLKRERRKVQCRAASSGMIKGYDTFLGAEIERWKVHMVPQDPSATLSLPSGMRKDALMQK